MTTTRKPTTGEKIAETVRVERRLHTWVSIPTLARRIDRAIAAAVRRERKRCAKIAQSFGGETYIGKNIADEIRSGK